MPSEFGDKSEDRPDNPQTQNFAAGGEPDKDAASSDSGVSSASSVLAVPADSEASSASAAHADPTDSDAFSSSSASAAHAAHAASRRSGAIVKLKELAVSRRGRSRLPIWASILIVLAVSVLIEVFVCNFRYWQSRDYEEIVLRDDPITISKADYSIGFGTLDLDIKNVQIIVDGPDDNSSVWVSLSVSDEGESKSYYLPVAQLHQNNERSSIHTVFTYGKVHSMRLSLPGDVWGGVDGDVLVASNSFPVTIERVSVNVPVPFEFMFPRFLMIFALALIVWMLWPSRATWRIPALSPAFGPTLARTCVLVATLVSLTVFWLLIPRWSGIATEFYNTTKYDYDEGGFIQLVGQPDTATNEYGKLAQAFANGQLNLLQEPPQWLIDMDDPYMYGARNAESATHTRGYLWDTAYYDGHYYVYFGVLPCLIFYLPFYLLTGEYFPNAVAVLIATLFFAVGWYSFLRALIQYKFKKTNIATFFLIYIGVLFCSGVMFGLGRGGLYNVPVTCGRALVVWGLCMWYRGWHKRSPVRLAVGSLLVACIAATRPQLLVVAPLILVPIVLTVRMTGKSRRAKAGWLACLIVPVVIVAAGVMWYNWARFDSPFDFGAQYNLTYNNMTMRGHSALRAVEGIYYSLFNPPTITTTFPFIDHAAIYPSFSGITIYEPLMGGLFWLSPMLLAIAFIFGLAKRGPRRDLPTFLFAGYFAAVGVFLVGFDADNAGILLRYFQDFGFLLGLSAALIFLYHLGGKGAKLPASYVALATEVNGNGGHTMVSKLPARIETTVPVQEKQPESVPGVVQPVPASAASTVALAPVAAQPVAEANAEEECPRRPTWAIALYVCIVIGVFMAIMEMLFMMNPVEGGVSGGGTYPEFWEGMRQMFQFWL